jgi:hypothetical protein
MALELIFVLAIGFAILFACVAFLGERMGIIAMAMIGAGVTALLCVVLGFSLAGSAYSGRSESNVVVVSGVAALIVLAIYFAIACWRRKLSEFAGMFCWMIGALIICAGMWLGKALQG